MNDEHFAKSQEIEFLIYEKYQTTIHNDKPKNINDFVDFLIETPLLELEVYIYILYVSKFCHSSRYLITMLTFLICLCNILKMCILFYINFSFNVTFV